MAIDQTTLSRINNLHPDLVTETRDLYLNQIVPTLTAISCRFACTLRTFDEQNILYAQGRTQLFDRQNKRLGIVTNASGGHSYHNYGLALDIVLIDNVSAYWDVVKDFDGDGVPDWMEIVKIFKNAGWEWGGDFKSIKDTPHFQKTFGYSCNDLLEKYNQKDFIPGSYYVNL